MPSASVIVRAHDSRAHLEELLPAFRRQTVAAELLVVDSGSRDGSVEVAARLSDGVFELEPGTYSPGRSLNLGARHAHGEIVFAFSSHCHLPSDDWIERSLAHYTRQEVGATNGAVRDPDRVPCTTPFFQDGVHARAHPSWGFSNHASSWRAAAWREVPFDEELQACEDRLWAIEMTARGWLIAFDPALWVSQAHRYSRGAARYLRRVRRELIVIGAGVPLPPYTLRSVMADWWHDIPEDRHSKLAHRLLNYRRAAGLLGTYLGHQEARRIRR